MTSHSWKTDNDVLAYDAIVYPGDGVTEAVDLYGELIDSDTAPNILDGLAEVAGKYLILPGTYAGAGHVVSLADDVIFEGAYRNGVILDDFGLSIGDGISGAQVKNLSITGSPGADLAGILLTGDVANARLQNLYFDMDSAPHAALRLTAGSGKTISGVVMQDLMATGNAHGYVLDGVGSFAGITMNRLLAWKCGFSGHHDTDVAGFTFPEPNTALHSNVLLKNSLAAYCYGTGFLPEGDLSSGPISLSNCMGHDNEQKESPAAGSEFEVINGTFISGIERGASADAYANALLWNCEPQGVYKNLFIANVHATNELKYKITGYATPADVVGTTIAAETALPALEFMAIQVLNLYDHIGVQVKSSVGSTPATWLADYWGGQQ